MASKLLKVKLWEDDQGSKWKRNVQEIDGEVLCGQSAIRTRWWTLFLADAHGLNTDHVYQRTVSQFTLLASTKKGNKPSFHKSAAPNVAKDLYDQFFNKVQSLYNPERVKNGVFQAMMDIALINDGPVGVDYCCEDGVVKLSECF